MLVCLVVFHSGQSIGLQIFLESPLRAPYFHFTFFTHFCVFRDPYSCSYCSTFFGTGTNGPLPCWNVKLLQARALWILPVFTEYQLGRISFSLLHCNMSPIVTLANTSSMSHSYYHCFVLEQLRSTYSLSNFEVCNTILLSIITTLCISSLGLIY